MPRTYVSKYVDIDIELSPYLISYLSELNKQAALVLNPKTEVGERVMRLFSYPPQGWRPRTIPIDRRFTFKIARHYFRDRAIGQYISDANRVVLAESIENLFWEDVCLEVRISVVKMGMNERAAIVKFREKHGISEEDYKLESMEKRYRRWKAERKTRIGTGFA